MDTLTHPIFADQTSEFTALQATPSQIDFTDWPLSPTLIAPLSANPNFRVTAPISDLGYFELEFHEGNNFWGCQFNYGNAACGTQIRQAFAHGLDKTIFVSTELPGNALAIDNPVPPAVDLNTPNPCAWDAQFPQSGSDCVVNGVQGTAYHLASASTGVACPGSPSTPPQPYTPGCGTPDFCAAASHLILAGLATGKNPTTCVLTGVSSSVATNAIQIFARSDDSPRLHAGQSYGQFICALFTGAFTTSCSGVITITPGGINSFPVFTRCLHAQTCTTGVPLDWWIYTGGFGSILAFDNSLFMNYHSQFVSGIPSIKNPSGPCNAAATPSFAPSNYMYICNSSYDTNISNAEFAPCLTNAGDPTTGQVTPTFANCPSTTVPTAASAAYKAQDIFGQNAYTIPLYALKAQFASLSGWQRPILSKAAGFTPPANFFMTLNAWNPSPALLGSIRQGFEQGTSSTNPFIGGTAWNNGVINQIFDSPGRVNPDSPQAYLDWMTVKTDQFPVSALSYTPPPGTTAAFRYTLRNDIFFHTGQRVTAWDLAFSYVAYKANGVMPGLAPMTGVKVLSPSQVDVDVSAVGPFTKIYLSNPIIPGRDWVNASVCTSDQWDDAVNNPNFPAANSALTGCIAQASAVTSSGAILPTASNVDSSKVQPAYDPVASGNLIGSGAWQCSAGSVIGGPGCSSSGTQSPPTGGQWTLTRYGVGTTPGGSLNTYFRSSGTLALYLWTGNRGIFSEDFLNLSNISVLCYGKVPVPTSCLLWSMGIGNPQGSSGSPVPIGIVQVAIVQRFIGVNWVAPYDWRDSPPQNMAPFPPVLFEGSLTMNPSGVAACTNSFNNGGGYDC